MFLFFIPQLFEWNFTENEMISKKRMLLHRFELFETDSLLKLRKKILERLFELHDLYPTSVENVFEEYINKFYEEKKEVYNKEQKLVYNFFKKNSILISINIHRLFIHILKS